jgi:hypothetical protein
VNLKLPAFVGTIFYPAHPKAMGVLLVYTLENYRNNIKYKSKMTVCKTILSKLCLILPFIYLKTPSFGFQEHVTFKTTDYINYHNLFFQYFSAIIRIPNKIQTAVNNFKMCK